MSRLVTATAVVYSIYDRNLTPLYVGLTGDIVTRLANHSYVQPWWADVDYIEVTRPMPRADAAAFEAGLIKYLQPAYNVEHRYGLSAAEIGNAVWVAERKAAQPALTP